MDRKYDGDDRLSLLAGSPANETLTQPDTVAPFTVCSQAAPIGHVWIELDELSLRQNPLFRDTPVVVAPALLQFMPSIHRAH